MPETEDAKVLFVDDEPLNCKYFQRVMKEFSVTTATSLSQARQIMSEIQFDVVIVDYRFDNDPNSSENGLDFLNSHNFGDRKPKIAICSAFHVIQDSLFDKGIYFIPKPIPYDVVKSWISSI